jgi:dTDP-4-dehydrorhamnose 3,5-epimerase
VKFRATAIAGCVLVEPEPKSDDRGFFARMFCREEFAEAGLVFQPVQINLSRNERRHTLRGLHFQDPPYAEAKLVQAVRGSVFDVVVDLRPDSKTFRQWAGFELNADSATALFIPEGCAHGFLTLADQTDVQYLMGRAHITGKAKGHRYDDPAFEIRWPHAPAVISPADLAWPSFGSDAIGA